MDVDIKLAQRLKSLRYERSISQYKLADALHVSRGLIGNYEQGTRQPDYSTLATIARYFDVSVDYILGLTDVRSGVLPSGMTPDGKFIANYLDLSDESKIEAQKYIELLSLKEKYEC